MRLDNDGVFSTACVVKIFALPAIARISGHWAPPGQPSMVSLHSVQVNPALQAGKLVATRKSKHLDLDIWIMISDDINDVAFAKKREPEKALEAIVSILLFQTPKHEEGNSS
jgi:hypothetical protein